jgi:mannose-6-phosphate isomerase-like protein (cupin superfamily)
MNETEYLGGRVFKRSLSVFHGAPPAGAVGPKRLLVPQGELAQIYDEEEGIRYIAFIELCRDGVRGNHWHKVKEEYLYVISGEVLLVVQDPNEGAGVSVTLVAGDLAFIACGVAHALKTIKPGQAIEFSKAKFDPIDIQRFTVV